jgi:hypothetical protein
VTTTSWTDREFSAILTAVTIWNRERDRERDAPPSAWQSAITLRMAAPADADALVRLAGLDSRPLPPGPHLLAECDRRIDAALSLSSDEVIADPFRRTAELCTLLRFHAAGLRATPPACPSRGLQLRPRAVAT